MNERSEQLLAELVEITRRQLANQERAIAQQVESVKLQAEAVARQRVALRRVWWLIAFVILAIVGIPVLNFFLRMG